MKLFKSLTTAFIAAAALAQNIAVLDSKQIITESAAYKAIANLPNTKYQAQKQDLEKLRDEYKALAEKLTQEKLTKSAAEYKTLEENMMAKRTALTAAQDKFGQQVSEDQNKQMQALFEKFQHIVEVYAKQNKIDMILNKQVVIASASNSVDVTAAVKQIFMKETK